MKSAIAVIRPFPSINLIQKSIFRISEVAHTYKMLFKQHLKKKITEICFLSAILFLAAPGGSCHFLSVNRETRESIRHKRVDIV